MEANNVTYKMQMPLVELADADEKQKGLLEKVRQEIKMIPNMHKAMVNQPGLLSTYLYGYSLFRKESSLTPAEQEVVFLTISAENNCLYCVGAHSLLADMVSKVPVQVTDAIRDNTEIPDEKLRALATFTSIMINKRGNPSPEDAAQFLKGGYTEQHILSIILAIAVKTISNYSNHVFHTELDAAFKAREWTGYKIARSVLKFFQRK